ncbi:ribonuclease H-like domain-containing protein [Tanacetum coccineum]
MKHAKARNVTERCFGLLKGRWKILASPSFFHITTQVRITLACCLLHNLIRKYMRFDPLELAQDELDKIENEEQLENEDYLAHIDPTDEWLDFRHEKTKSKRAWETLNGKNPFSYVCDRGNHRRGVQKETLCRLGLQVEITERVGKVPSNYHGSLCSLRMRVSSPECVDKALYYPGFHGDHHDNSLLTKETESKPIIWDIGDEEEEYPFVSKYPSFQEEPIVLVKEKSCPVYDTDNEEEESMPVYDTDIEDVIEEEEGFVGKKGFSGEEDNIEDIVVVANDICSSMIQTTLSVDVEEDVNTKSHELMSFGKKYYYQG